MLFRFGNPIVIFFYLALFNFLFRFPEILSLTHLNEDTALIDTALRKYSSGTLDRLFYSSYGPNVIRPFQLIGMAYEQVFFEGNVLASQLVNVCILSLSQSFLFYLLIPIFGFFGTLLSVLPLSLSVLLSDANYWLSNRHDLYLIVFFSLALLFASRALKGSKLSLALLFLSYWGAFFSNEKATAIPVVVCLFSLMLLVSKYEGDVRKFVKSFVGVLAASLSAFVSYFVFRFWVLGKIVGGYDDTLLEPGQRSLEFLFSWIWQVVTLPFRQATLEGYQASTILLGAALLVFVITYLARNGRTAYLQIALALLALLAASLPTVRFMFPDHYVSVSLSRMMTLPVVTSAILYGALFGYSYRNQAHFARRSVVFLFGLAYLAQMGVAGKFGVQCFVSANEYTKSAVQGAKEYCSCRPRVGKDFGGLRPVVDGVAVYTEDLWFDYQLKYEGMQPCENLPKEEHCIISFRHTPQHKLYIHPTKKSESLLVHDLKQHPFLGKSKKVAAQSFIDRFEVEDRLLTVTGWAFRGKNFIAPTEIWLVINNQPAFKLIPNVERLDVFQGPQKIGFDFSFILPTNLRDENKIDLYARFPRKSKKSPAVALLKRELFQFS